jgi:hypothetical protein
VRGARGTQGLFVQEDAGRALREPGQHDNFGALKSWDYIHSLLDHETRLLLLIRHGEAWSNRVHPALPPLVIVDPALPPLVIVAPHLLLL